MITQEKLKNKQHVSAGIWDCNIC